MKDEKIDLEGLLDMEGEYLNQAFSAIASHDPHQARETMRRLMVLPPEAKVAMSETPVGEVPQIPVDYSEMRPVD